jgi:PleD family two-component response regulator
MQYQQRFCKSKKGIKNVDELLKEADIALYEAKGSG